MKKAEKALFKFDENLTLHDAKVTDEDLMMLYLREALDAKCALAIPLRADKDDLESSTVAKCVLILNSTFLKF